MVQVKMEKMKIMIIIKRQIEDIKEDRMSLVIWGFSCVLSTCLERAGFINSLVPYLQNVTHFLL